MLAFKLDPKTYYKLSRFERQFLTGGNIVNESIKAMSEFDSRPKPKS